MTKVNEMFNYENWQIKVWKQIPDMQLSLQLVHWLQCHMVSSSKRKNGIFLDVWIFMYPHKKEFCFSEQVAYHFFIIIQISIIQLAQIFNIIIYERVYVYIQHTS